MKITKARLAQIIKEELSAAKAPEPEIERGEDVMTIPPPDEDVELPENLDALQGMREEMIKLKKTELQRIIKEELSLRLTEGDDWFSDEYETLADRKFADSIADPDGDADDAAELRDIAADLEAKAGKPSRNIEKDWREIHKLGADIEDRGEGSWDDAMDAEAVRRGYDSWDHLNSMRSKKMATTRRTQSIEDIYGVGGEEFRLRENKITKSQLKRIIKEELESALKEVGPPRSYAPRSISPNQASPGTMMTTNDVDHLMQLSGLRGMYLDEVESVRMALNSKDVSSQQFEEMLQDMPRHEKVEKFTALSWIYDEIGRK